MPHPCVVCGRSRMNPNNKSEDYTFFGFPVSDETRCLKWLEFCCREEMYKLTKKQLLQRMICCKHFQRSNFAPKCNDRLTTFAVPTIYDPKQSLYNIGCVLCGRFRKDPPGLENDGATFHHFPGEEFRCLKWLDFVGVDSYYRLTRKEIMYCYICSKHFDKSQFVPGFRNRLTDTAVPNIRNPDDNEEVSEKHGYDLPSDEKVCTTAEKNVPALNPLPLNVLESQACAACGRLRTDPKNKKEKFKFHPFPAYEIGRYLKWCQFLGREDILKMSPNQIRKLVLCSGHFQAGQNFMNGSGCDAVPNIWDFNDNIQELSPKENNSMNKEDQNKILRPAVSSKKPKVDSLNHPTPLAKKRGKSKRPISVKIPKIEIRPKESYFIPKLPIPSVNNWKLMSNKFQPINLQSSVVSAASTINKVILPFHGDISKLGNPIPVDSLANMPPGLLIKIDLPEQEKRFNESTKNKNKNEENHTQPVQFVVQNQPLYSTKTTVQPQFIKCENISENFFEDEFQVQNDSFENSFVDESETIIEVDNEITHEQVKDEAIIENIQPKVKMSSHCRRTLIPIQNELRRFLKNIKPHIRRLPKKSKAQVKFAIVNMVIDRL